VVVVLAQEMCTVYVARCKSYGLMIGTLPVRTPVGGMGSGVK